MRLLDTAPSVERVWPDYHSGAIYCAAWGRGGLIATGGSDKAVRLARWGGSGLSSLEPIEDLLGHTGTVRSVNFDDDAGLFFSAGAGDCTVGSCW